MRPLLIALSLLLVLLHSSSNAELRWPQPIQAFQRTPEDHELTATYSFQNVGNLKRTSFSADAKGFNAS